MGFLTSGDINAIHYEDDDWQIRWHQNRGYEPWYTLHKRRRFMGLSWWSWMLFWSVKKDPLVDFIKRWRDWPPASR